MRNNREIIKLGGQTTEGDPGSAKISGEHEAQAVKRPGIKGELLSPGVDACLSLAHLAIEAAGSSDGTCQGGGNIRHSIRRI